jgi:hypothetical protein
VISSVVFVGAFFLARQVVSTYKTRAAVGRAFASADRMKKEAKAKHPGMSSGEALLAESDSLGKAMIAGNSLSKRTQAAADVFWGFYFSNTRARPAFCADKGQPIPTFAKDFAAAHNPEVERAQQLYRESGASADRLYQLLEVNLTKQIDASMHEEAQTIPTTVNQLCQIYEANASALVPRMLFSLRLPVVERELMGQ